MKYVALMLCLLYTSVVAAKRPSPLAKVEDEPNLPRVLLIGDSISIGYTLPVREFLKGKVNIHRIPTNGGPTTRGLTSIDAWLGKGKWDLIHFNWGLHDLKFMGPNSENLFPKEKGGKAQVPLDEYESNLDKLTARMKKTGARLVWRNTTPIPSGSKGRYMGDSVKYNEAAARVMKKHNVPTQDLFTVSKERMEELMLPANVHYKKEGSRLLGELVAKRILKELGK
jgi:lysophospholipase L1-like esterase